MKSKYKSIQLLGVIALAGFSAPAAYAVNAAWNTDAATGDFGSTNWTGGTTTPAAGGTYTVVSGDALFFGTSATTILNNNLSGATYGGLTFNSGASAFTIGGNSFTLSGGITNNSTSAQTINNAVTLSSADHTFNAASGNLLLGGAFSGTTGNVTISGPNTVTLSGTNTFNTKSANFKAFNVTGNLSVTGSTTVDGTGFTDYRGYLNQNGNSTITVQSGGSLAINTSTRADMNSGVGNNAAGTSTLHVNGGSFSLNGGGGFFLGNNVATATGVLTISTGTATINRGSTTATDARSFIAMGRDLANGTINLNGGVLATDRNFVRDGGSATANGGTANFNFGGGTLRALADQTDWLNSSLKNTNQQALSAVTATGTSTIDANGFSVAINSNISGTGGFNIDSSTGTGTVTFGGASTYFGKTTVTDGTLVLGAGASIANSSEIALNGGNFNVSAVTGYSTGASQLLTGNGGSITGNITVNGTLAIGNSPGTMTFNNDLTLGTSSISNFEFTVGGFTLGSYDLALGGDGSQQANFGGTLNLLFDSGETYTNGSSVKIFDFETYDGDFAALTFSGLGSGQSATFDSNTGFVTVIPEPGAALLGGLGMLALLRRRRH